MSNKTAFVISGGGAGIVHAFLSIEKHLAEGNPWPDFCVGTSAGGLISIMLCTLGLDGTRNQLRSIRKRSDIFANQVNVSKGLWSARPLQKRIANIIRTKPFIPYYVCAYDLSRQQKVYFKHNDGWHHLASTACIPVLVSPIDSIYTDGGVVENTPLSFAIKQGATKIDLFTCFKSGSGHRVDPPNNVIEVMAKSLEAMRIECAKDDVRICKHMNDQGLPHIDVTLHEPERNLVGVLDFHKIRYFI